ncbi:MAG: undecaprenyl-phosphate glucose phosphotransferase [Bacteroidetes bacterium]|nr:undecaprenyl-phosphate glucose phosphotransferase [Bacteroidota bacterium]
MQLYRQSLHILRVATDFLALTIAFQLSISYIVQFKQWRPMIASDNFLLLALLVVWFFSSRNTALYDDFRTTNFSFEVVAVLKNTLIQTISCVCILFLMKDITLSRTFVLVYTTSSFFIVTFERFAFRKILIFMRRRGRNLRQIVIVGAGEVGKDFYDSIMLNPHFGYVLVGFLDDEQKTFLNGKYLGTIDDLDQVLTENVVDDVIVALPNHATKRLEQVMTVSSNHTTRVKIIPDYFRYVSDRFDVSMFGRFPVISVRKDKLDELHWYILKRAFDAAFSLAFVVLVLSWLIPIISILIRLTSKGPAFFKQERWGRRNKKIVCYKFRSMIESSQDVDEQGRYQQASPDDPRVTKIGRFLRKTNLDELPQFWNVLKGEMSVVGPRPHPTPLNIQSRDIIENYMLRHLVKPGITGWAQINGYRGETKDPVLMQKRVDHDIWYIENWSFWLDIQIILLTVWQMIKWDTKGY